MSHYAILSPLYTEHLVQSFPSGAALTCHSACGWSWEEAAVKYGGHAEWDHPVPTQIPLPPPSLLHLEAYASDAATRLSWNGVLVHSSSVWEWSGALPLCLGVVSFVMAALMGLYQYWGLRLTDLAQLQTRLPALCQSHPYLSDGRGRQFRFWQRTALILWCVHCLICRESQLVQMS